MPTMLIVLLVAGLTTQGPPRASSSMPEDIARLIRAAENLTGTWPSQAPPPIPEVGIVVRHGKSIVPLLLPLLSDEPDIERDRKRWKVQQQVALALPGIS